MARGLTHPKARIGSINWVKTVYLDFASDIFAICLSCRVIASETPVIHYKQLTNNMNGYWNAKQKYIKHKCHQAYCICMCLCICGKYRIENYFGVLITTPSHFCLIGLILTHTDSYDQLCSCDGTQRVLCSYYWRRYCTKTQLLESCLYGRIFLSIKLSWTC